jgi:arylsulfatase A-like enzyme
MKSSLGSYFICTTALAGASYNCSSQQTKTKQEPNVLFIIIDQFRQDIAGTYGGSAISTPNIDKLARSGVVFNNAVSTCPVSTPYRGMLLTGRYPTHTGILVNFVNVTTDNYKNSLGSLFADAGYQTGFIGKWHLGAGGWTNFSIDTKDRKGIDEENNYIPPGPGRMGFDYWAAYNFHAQFNNYFYFSDSPSKVQTDQYETDVQVSQAIDFMENKKGSSRPFFLVLSTHPPHPPFNEQNSPKGYLEKVPEEINWEPNVPKENNPRSVEAMRYYLAMAKNIDDNIGRIIDYLEKSGLDKNTIVVFTADHGEMNGSHGEVNKQKPFKEAISIPLIYSFPGVIKEGLRKKVPFTPMDHLPTLCSLAGIKIPKGKDGVNLAGVIKNPGKDVNRDVLIGNYVSSFNTFSTGTTFPEWRGVYSGGYTYAKWLTGREEFYDNTRDPYQFKNLVDDMGSSKLLGEFRIKLKNLLVEAGDDFLPGSVYGKWFDEYRYPIMSEIPGNQRKN